MDVLQQILLMHCFKTRQINAILYPQRQFLDLVSLRAAKLFSIVITDVSLHQVALINSETVPALGGSV